MMNNYPPAEAAAAGPWCCRYNDDNAGLAAAAVPTSGETSSFFADMFADYSTDDLFELVWEQEEGQVGAASGSSSSIMQQPAVSCLWSPRLSRPADDVQFDPPSEDEIADWLCSIVKGEELACNDDDGGRRPVADALPEAKATMTDTKKETVPTTEGMMMMGTTKKMRNAPAAGGRRSHHGEAHDLTEKRRRQKINERLKTLQQLVPGCSKSNQASTLDQTIHYMKSLQHQVQAMSVGLAPAVYPVVQARCVPQGTPAVTMPFAAAPMVVGGYPPSSPMMVPFGRNMIQLPHYPAAAVIVPAAVAYPAAAPTSTAVAPGDAMSVSHLHGTITSSKGKGSSSLCVAE